MLLACTARVNCSIRHTVGDQCSDKVATWSYIRRPRVFLMTPPFIAMSGRVSERYLQKDRRVCGLFVGPPRPRLPDCGGRRSGNRQPALGVRRLVTCRDPKP